MAKNLKQLQDEVLRGIESNKDQFREVTSLPPVEQLLVLSAANFILKVQENLRSANKIDTGRLETDIAQGDVIRTPNGYSISVGYPEQSQASKYYDFVNKGVQGVENQSKAPRSPYKFKNVYPSKKMALELLKWYRRNTNAVRGESQSTIKSPLQKKRKKLSTMVNQSNRLKSLAYATAVSIKKKGLKTTGFFDKAVESSFGNEFVDAMAKIVGESLKIIITNVGNNK